MQYYDYKKTLIDNVLVGMYYYILNNNDLNSNDSLVTGLTSTIESISYNPFIEKGDVVCQASKFNSEKYMDESFSSDTPPYVYRITQFKGIDKTLGEYNIQLEYDSLDKNFESKLLLYPFRYFMLTDHINPPMLIKPQLMETVNGKWVFKVFVALSQTSKYLIYPYLYKLDTVGNLEGIVNNNPLLLPVTSNQYSAWITSQGNTFAKSNELALMENDLTQQLADRNNALNTIGGMTRGLEDIFTWQNSKSESGSLGRNGIMNVVGSAVRGLENKWQNWKQHSLKEYEIHTLALARTKDYLNTPRVVKTIGNDTSFNLANSKRKVELIEYGLTPQREMRIKEYFIRYGYKVNNYEKPNFKSRKYFNFIKTINCDIDSAKIPYNDLLSLQEIFNSGVTFWHIDNGATIKNYDVNNSEV